MLSLNQLQNVCLVNVTNSMRCRYLAHDDNDPNIWYCQKKNKKSEIDDEINEFIKEQKSKGVDPYSVNVPLGNNCEGYPILKHIVQGYDQ